MYSVRFIFVLFDLITAASSSCFAPITVSTNTSNVTRKYGQRDHIEISIAQKTIYPLQG